MGELADRRTATRGHLSAIRGELGEAATRCAGKACVYATGSFGRCEASRYSDLDLFIVGKVDKDGGRLLNRLDEICIKADLIEVTRRLGIPEFSGDGRYLQFHTVRDFTKTLGKQEDDVTNTFTARLLLLLESCALLEPDVYADAIGDVVTAYWRDYEDHKSTFMPAFLANDILRLWRTFCVNYEARTERQPEPLKAKGKLKNYKLKHSRLLTCYSAVLCLLAVYNDQKTVSPDEAVAMIRRSPTERLEWLLAEPGSAGMRPNIVHLLEQYDAFLQVTNAPEEDLVAQFLDKSKSREYTDSAYEFGDTVFKVLQGIGGGHRFHRLLVV